MVSRKTMDLITTHINADFDALGSLVAAKKLYPDSRLLLPGSQEKSVREFLGLAKDEISVLSEKECRLEEFDRLILVDTRHRSRIGIASELVDRGIETHVYDHHPRMKGDVVADKDVYEQVGATITILADMIKKKRVKLSYLEATLMLLGIYEETGSLTYRTTTKMDVDMVSFLLSQGANLSAVSSYLNRELSEAELSLLTRLIGATEHVTVKGINISMIELDSENYVGELGLIISKLQAVENIPVLFVLIKTKGKRVDIIARSSLPGVNVNKVLAHFGGGGHASAAAAKVHGGDAPTVRAKLLKLLGREIKIKVRASDIMSSEMKTIGINERIDTAKKTLLEERVSAMPVIDKGRIKGAITMRAINKAVKRGFGHSRVKGYMSFAVTRVRHDAPLASVQKAALEMDTGIILVTLGRKDIGVINRTDILRSLYKGLFAGPKAVSKRVVVNMSGRMNALLPKNIIELLVRIGALAKSSGYSAFVVGGLVRDLVMGVKNLDLDIVIEGDAIGIARALSHELGAALIVHKRFGTATVVTKERLKIDLATARKELYERPAALPTVEFSSLKDDLVRRDFTINAMAVSINSGNFGQLIDFFGGQADLASGRIAVMHDGSFIDDPTRIFRAVRFEQRFGFTIDPHTEELIQNAVDEEMFGRVEPQRIRDEAVLILKEEEPIRALRRMSDLHELRFIHPKIGPGREIERLFAGIADIISWYEAFPANKRPIDRWLMYLMALLDRLSYKDAASVCVKYVFRRGETIRILSCKENGRRLAKRLRSRKPMKPSAVYGMLKDLSYEVILFIAARENSPVLTGRIKGFLQRYNNVRIFLKGDDLKSLGLKPGPKYSRILKMVLDKKIDGVLKTRNDEMKYARRLLR